MRDIEANLADRPATRNLAALKRLLQFASFCRWRLALGALLITAGSLLVFGQVIRVVVDSGLGMGSAAALDRALLLFLFVVGVTAGAILVRLPGSRRKATALVESHASELRTTGIE